MDSKSLALRLADLAFDKKAFELKILNVTGLASYTDFLILCSGRSDRQVQAVADHIAVTMKKEEGVLPRGVEGESLGQWVLMDYGDVVIHVFNAPVREVYDLDGLWSDASVLPVATPPWEAEMRQSMFDQGIL